MEKSRVLMRWCSKYVRNGKRIWWKEEKTQENYVTRSWRRNWLDMPNEVMTVIFIKLGTVWVLGVAQHVCSLWHKLAKQPILYRYVGIHDHDLHLFFSIFYGRTSIGSLARLAVDRSCGQTLQISCSGISMLDFYPQHLSYIADSSSSVSLKSLRLGKRCHFESHQLTSIIKEFTSLEELYLFEQWNIPKQTVVEIGHACRKLKYLRTGKLDFSGDMAFVIAENMPGLHRLHLNGDSLTIHGFQAILNGCPHLEYLRLRGASNLSAASLKEQFTRINNIRILSKGKVDEYEFDIEKTGTRRASLESSVAKAYTDDVSDYTVYLYKAPFQDEFDIEAYYG